MLDMITFNAMLVKIPNPKVGHSLEYFHHLMTSLCQKHHSLLLLLLCYEFSNQVLEEGLGGTITSANFPENYEHNTDCSFTIVPVPGNHVALKVNLVNKKYNALSFTGTMLYIFNVRSFYQNVQKIKIYP